MKKLILSWAFLAATLAVGMVACDVSEAGDFGNGKGYGWQERARVCTALTEDQCTLVVALQMGGGDGSGGASGESGDAGAGAGAAGASGDSGSGAAGAAGGASGDSGCSK